MHASYAGSDAARWRRCAAHDDDKVRIARTKQEKLNYRPMQSNPNPNNRLQLKTTTQNQKEKQPSQQTPCSINQTYRRDSVLPNEKDGPKMTTAQCNRPRR